jgi:hypothetical protein
MYMPSACNAYDTETFISSELCCICGGGTSYIDETDGDEDQTGECSDIDNGVTDRYGYSCS